MGKEYINVSPTYLFMLRSKIINLYVRDIPML